MSTHRTPSERVSEVSGHREAHLAESREGEGRREACKPPCKEPLGVAIETLEENFFPNLPAPQKGPMRSVLLGDAAHFLKQAGQNCLKRHFREIMYFYYGRRLICWVRYLPSKSENLSQIPRKRLEVE